MWLLLIVKEERAVELLPGRKSRHMWLPFSELIHCALFLCQPPGLLLSRLLWQKMSACSLCLGIYPRGVQLSKTPARVAAAMAEGGLDNSGEADC